jgi:hypothetical protein
MYGSKLLYKVILAYIEYANICVRVCVCACVLDTDRETETDSKHPLIPGGEHFWST